MRDVEQSFDRGGQKLRSAGATLTAAFTLPIVAGLGGAAKAAISFESTFAGVRKTVAGVTDSQGQLTSFGQTVQREFRELAKTMPASVEEINRVGEAAGALGVRGKDLTSFTATMIKMGETTNLSSDVAATGLARLQNTLDPTREHVTNLASAIVALGNDGASTEADILEMSLRIAGAGATVGMTAGDVLGLANAMSSLGIEAEMGGTAMQKSILNVAKAVSAGGPELNNYAKIARMTSDEFATLFKQDPGAAFGRFLQGISDIKSSGGDLISVLGTMGVEEARLLNTMLRVGASGTLVAESMKLGNKAFVENNALNREYQQRLQTTSSQLRIVWNRVRDLGIELGGALLPVIKDLIGYSGPVLAFLTRAVEGFGKLPGPIKATALGAAGLLAVLGPVLVVAGAVAGGVSSIVGVLALFAPAAATVAVGATKMTIAVAGVKAIIAAASTAIASAGGVIIAFVTSPITLAVAAVAALALGVRYLTGSWSFIVGPARAVWSVMTDLWTIASSLASMFGNTLLGAAQRVWAVMKEFGSSLRTHVVDGIKGAFEAMRLMHPELAWLIDKIGWLLGAGKNAVVDAAKTARGALRDTATNLADRANPVRGMKLPDAPRGYLQNIGPKPMSPEDMRAAEEALTKPLSRTLPVPSASDLTGGTDKDKERKDIIEETKEKIAELNTALIAAARNGAPLSTILDEYGSTLKDVGNKHAIFKDQLGELPPAIRAVQAASLKSEMRAFEQETAAATKGIEYLMDAGRDVPDAFANSYSTIIDATREFYASNRRVGKSELDKQLADIETNRKAAVLKLGAIPNDPFLRAEWKKGQAAITEYFDHQVKLATGTADTIVERMRAAGVKTRRDLTETAQSARRDYEQMKASGEFTAAAVAEAWERAYNAERSARDKWGDGFRKTMSDAFGTVANQMQRLAEISGDSESKFSQFARGIGIIAGATDAAAQGVDGLQKGLAQLTDGDIVAGLSNVAAGAMQVAGAFMAATNSKSKTQNALGGAMVGAQVGSMFGPWGAAIGAAAGLVGGLLRGKPAWAKAADEVGRDFGVKISEGLAKEIDKTAKEKFGGNRQAASLFSLDKIIAEAGGVKPATLAGFTKNLRDAFSMKDVGKFSLEQLTETLDKNFTQLADVAKKKGGLITSELREIIALNDRFGANSAAIADHVKSSLTSGLGHLTSFLQASASAAGGSADAIKKEMAEIDKERAAYMGKELSADDKTKADELDKRWDKLKQQLASTAQLKSALSITNASSGGAFAAAIAGSFQKMLGAGMDPTEALAQVEPAVTALQGQLDALGIDGGAAFSDLRAQIAMTKDEVAGPSVAAMRSLGLAMTDLYNGGVLTSDMFVGMSAQIGQTFESLVAQGHDGKTAMSLLKPQLQQMWEMQQRFGVELDDSTQKLLDEAEAAGIVGDEHKSASERTVDGIGKVVDRLDLLLEGMGIKLPEAIGKGAEEVARKAGKIKDEIDGIVSRVPRKIDVDVDLTFNRRDGEDNRSPAERDRTPIVVPGAADGVFTAKPTLRVFGEGGEPELGGPVDFMARALAGALSQLGVNAAGEKTGKTTVVPVAMFYSDAAGFDMTKVNQHLASEAGINGNDFGLREVIESIALNVYRRERSRNA